MTITARYPGRCARCGGTIQAGSEIDWDKSTRATRHVACPAKSAATAPAAKPAATAPAAPPPAIERLAARYAGTCAGCGGTITVGASIEYHRAERAAYHVACAGKAQEPAPITTSFTARHRDELPTAGYTFRTRQGQLLTIVRATTSRVSQDEVDDQDDYRHGGDPFWVLTAHCREATEAESAPVLAREKAKAIQAATRRRLEEIVGLVRRAENYAAGPFDLPMVEGVEPCAVRISSICTLRVAGNGIWVHESTYDDSHDWRIPYDAALAAEIQELAPIGGAR